MTHQSEVPQALKGYGTLKTIHTRMMIISGSPISEQVTKGRCKQKQNPPDISGQTFTLFHRETQTLLGGGFRGVQFRWQSPHNEKLEPSETTSFATNASPRKGQVHQTDSYQRLSLPPTQCNCHLPLSKLLSTKTAKRWHRSTIVSCYTQNEGKKENMEKYTIRGNFYNFFFSLLCRFIDRAFFLAFRLVSSKSWHCVVTVPNDMHRGTFFFSPRLFG